MANRYSVATSNWNSTSTWSDTSGGSAGASIPGAGDTAYIRGGYTVTIPSGYPQTIHVVEIDGATLTLNDSLYMDQASVNCYILINATANSNLQITKGISIATNSGAPNYPWRFRLVVTSNVRTLQLSGLNLIGNAPVLSVANGDYNVFNANASTPGYTGLTLYKIDPLTGTPKLINHSIPGRTTGGRTYPNGRESREMTVYGFGDYNAKNVDTLETIKALNAPVSFTGWYSHMQRGYVDDIKYTPKTGILYFAMTLVEDL